MKKHYEAVPVEEAAKIAQWVIDNRYPKPGKERMTDTEMYHLLKDKIEKLQSEVGSSVSSDAHTREVAEKAFEAARKINEDTKFPIIELEFETFEDYLNSLNPEGK